MVHRTCNLKLGCVVIFALMSAQSWYDISVYFVNTVKKTGSQRRVMQRIVWLLPFLVMVCISCTLVLTSSIYFVQNDINEEKQVVVGSKD